MGLAFVAALLVIYSLIVWQFNNLTLAALIMAPIPLSLIGIIPGHWLLGVEFTATSMIGLISLGGIMVRQSILMLEFVTLEVAKGMSVTEAAITGAEMRMRPILITSLTAAGVAWTLMFDPIFQGMAVSTFFGVLVGTLLMIITIPLGCISLKRSFYVQENVDGELVLSSRYQEVEFTTSQSFPIMGKIDFLFSPSQLFNIRGKKSSAIPLWLHLWQSGITFIIHLIAIIVALFEIIAGLWTWIKVVLDLLLHPPRLQPRKAVISSPVVVTPPSILQVENPLSPVATSSSQTDDNDIAIISEPTMNDVIRTSSHLSELQPQLTASPLIVASVALPIALQVENPLSPIATSSPQTDNNDVVIQISEPNMNDMIPTASHSTGLPLATESSEILPTVIQSEISVTKSTHRKVKTKQLRGIRLRDVDPKT